MKYRITIEVDSDSDPRDWILEQPFIIDEPYEIISIQEEADV